MDGKGKRKPPKELRKKGGVDDLTEAGTLLGAVGGIVIGSSALVAWVSSRGVDLNVFDLVQENRLYLILLVSQLLSLVCAMISAIMLRSSNWPRDRKVPWALPLIALNVVMIVFIAFSLVLMEGDYLGDTTGATYGPGPFLAIFGMMFSMVGALMFVLDARDKNKARTAHQTGTQRRYSEQLMREPVEVSYIECPYCGEDVPDDSPMCPNCKAILTDDQQTERPLGEDEIDEVL